MAEVLQLEEITVARHDVPKLLVEWSSPWHEFTTSIRPALSKSEARLAGEAPFGVIPLRIMLPSWLLEAFLIFCAIVIPTKLAELRPYIAPKIQSHDVIYYSGDELPRTEDLGGAESGRHGRAGGSETHHRTQTIRIARGGSLVPRVVDAPNLKLPSSRDAVANLLAIRPVPGPPPSQGLRSRRTVPSLEAAMVAPAPDVTRDYTRNGIKLDSTIAPAPSVARDVPLVAPNISATLIAPAPTVSRDHSLVAPALAPTVIAPAPNISRDRSKSAPSLDANVVAPAPNVSRDKSRSAPALSSSVIPPAPGAVSRDISRAPVQMANVAVVQPPVSAPERAAGRDAKLNMPAPAVIAPPPSADISQDMRHVSSGSIPDASKSVVPPPPTAAGSGSFVSSLIGRIFGPSEAVPPPPSVNTNANSTRNGSGTSLSANVVPPPPSVNGSASGGNPKGVRNGSGSTLGSSVIAPPPPVAGVSGGSGTRPLSSSTARAQGLPDVVPPPPSLSGPGGGTGISGGGAGAGGNLLASNVVPPPPSVGGGDASSGTGSGRHGAGRGAPMDMGSAIAPPSTGGSGNAGVVISDQPGTRIGVPPGPSNGALAMSPTGADKAGIGGAGGGTGIGRGTGPGSGLNGEGPGAGKTDSGRGSDPSARGGISPNAGPGGAGNAPSGTPAVPGVSVQGGSSQITLPSFGNDPQANDPRSSANRPGFKPRDSFDVDVVATAGSGGPFEAYRKLLHGETHTTYPDTASSLGMAVMYYADESGSHSGVLRAPQSIRTNLPDGLPKARMVVTCNLDTSGNLRNLRVLEPGPADMTAKVVAALHSWKFQPALRGDQPVEVTAILGFNINTDDRF